MWATARQSREEIIGLYNRAWEHADATIAALDLDARGKVPWWGSDGEVTLHQILVHMTAELNRHAGHADILREQLDGSVGRGAGNSNLPEHDAAWWQEYRGRLEDAAREAAAQ